MKNVLSRFHKDQSGAVTVDWVVLCAAVVAMAAAIVMSIEDGTTTLSEDVGTYITTQEFF